MIRRLMKALAVLCPLWLATPPALADPSPVTNYPAGWAQDGTMTTLAASIATSNAVLGGKGPSAYICNTGTSNNASVKLGGAGVAAATTDFIVAAGGCNLLSMNGATVIAAITATGTTTITVSVGTGSPQASNPSSGGGGGGCGALGGVLSGPCDNALFSNGTTVGPPSQGFTGINNGTNTLSTIGNLYTPTLTCDAVTSTGDGAITSGQATFTTGVVTFASADVGKTISVANVGANQFLASAAVSAAGTGYIPFSTITLSPGSGTASTNAAARVTNTKVVSATVAAGGSGGSAGTQTVTGTTGFGTKFTASVTVSGGAITAVLSIASGGSYTVNPTTLATEPVTGASLVGAQLNVVMGVATVNVYTPGTYSVVDAGAGSLTQSATTGAGTGATLTGTFQRYPLVTTISSFISASSVGLAANASATASTADFWTYGTNNTAPIQAAITAAHGAGGGLVQLASLGKPCLVATGISLTQGVTLAGVRSKNFPGSTASATTWGGFGTWLQSVDLTNPAVTLTNHGVAVDGLNFIYGQPVPGGSWQPVPYPFAIQGCSNESRIEHIVDVAGTHGLNINCSSGSGGGTGMVLNDLQISTSMVGMRISNVNDTLTTDFLQVRNLYYNTNAQVVSYLEANLIGMDIGYFDNSHLHAYQCFQCFAGMLFTNGTTLGNTHSAFSFFASDLQFNLDRAALVTTDGATVTARMVDFMVHGDTGNSLSDPLLNLVSDNVTIDLNSFVDEAAGGAVAVLGNGTGSSLLLGDARFISWASVTSGLNALTANAGAVVYTGGGGILWGSASNQMGGAGRFYTQQPAFTPNGGSCPQSSTNDTSLYLSASNQPGLCAGGFPALVGFNTGGVGGTVAIGSTAMVAATDVLSINKSANATRSFTIDNTSSGGSAATAFFMGNNTAGNEVSFTLRGGGNSGGNGANSLTLASAGGFFLPSVTNMPALTASLPIFTDASKNFTSTAPSGYSAVLSGTTGNIGGGALTPGACAAGTATVTGATTSMASVASPAADPDSVLSTGIAIYSFVSSSNTVTVRICAIVAVTPAAVAYNVRVLQ